MIGVTRIVRASLILALTLSSSAFAKCPISDGATLVVRSAVGDLHVDTAGHDSADVQVDNNAVQVQETCGKDVVQFTANASDQTKGTIGWKITVPRTVHLDLVTMAGNITAADVDGNAILRTAGGSVTIGN